MLREYDQEAAIYAGGTELLVLMKERLAHFPHLIDIKPVPGLAGITLDNAGGSITIGPLASHRQIETSPLVRQHAPLLADVEGQIANIRVRHAGTIGGNLCFAEPHSDPATLLVAWDALFTLTSETGSRTIPAGEFFVGLLETARQHQELLTSITVPVLPASTGSAYKRFKTHERPTATVAAVISVANGEFVDCRVVAGSVGNRPERIYGVETLMRGTRPSGDLWQSARSIAMDEVTVEAEGFESVDYKRHLIGVLAERALQEAARRAV